MIPPRTTIQTTTAITRRTTTSIFSNDDSDVLDRNCRGRRRSSSKRGEADFTLMGRVPSSSVGRDRNYDDYFYSNLTPTKARGIDVVAEATGANRSCGGGREGGGALAAAAAAARRGGGTGFESGASFKGAQLSSSLLSSSSSSSSTATTFATSSAPTYSSSPDNSPSSTAKSHRQVRKRPTSAERVRAVLERADSNNNSAHRAALLLLSSSSSSSSSSTSARSMSSMSSSSVSSSSSGRHASQGGRGRGVGGGLERGRGSGSISMSMPGSGSGRVGGRGSNSPLKKSVRHGVGSSTSLFAPDQGGGISGRGMGLAPPPPPPAAAGGGGRGLGAVGGLDPKLHQSMNRSMATRSIAASILDLANEVGADGDIDDNGVGAEVGVGSNDGGAGNKGGGGFSIFGRQIGASRPGIGGNGGRGAGGIGAGAAGGRGGFGLHNSLSRASRNVLATPQPSATPPSGAVDTATQYIWDTDDSEDDKSKNKPSDDPPPSSSSSSMYGFDRRLHIHRGGGGGGGDDDDDDDIDDIDDEEFDGCPDPDGESYPSSSRSHSKSAASRLFGGAKMTSLMSTASACGSVVSLDPQDHMQSSDLDDSDHGGLGRRGVSGSRKGVVQSSVSRAGETVRNAAWTVAAVVTELKHGVVSKMGGTAGGGGGSSTVTPAPAKRGIGNSRAASRCLGGGAGVSKTGGGADDRNLAPKSMRSFGSLDVGFQPSFFNRNRDEFLDSEDRALGCAGFIQRQARKCERLGERFDFVGSGNKWSRRAPLIVTMVVLLMIVAALVAVLAVAPGNDSGDGGVKGGLGMEELNVGVAGVDAVEVTGAGDAASKTKATAAACPQDEFLCVDETILYRDPDRGCQFPPCPGLADPDAKCPDESFVCGDGKTTVYPNPNDGCCFDPCPPGFAPPTEEGANSDGAESGGAPAAAADRFPSDAGSVNAATVNSSSAATNVDRYDAVESVVAAAGITTPEAFRNRHSAQHRALSWLADTDSAKLDPNHPALLQRYALAVLYYSTQPGGGSGGGGGKKTSMDEHRGWTNSDGWMSKRGICSWYGVTCPSRDGGGDAADATAESYDDNVDVVGLNLTSNGMMGSLPAELAALSSLQTLDLSSNRIVGTIPEEALSFMTELRAIVLSGNELSGPLPASLENSGNLVYLDLGANGGLTGSIPPSLGELADLEVLKLELNQLGGSISPKLFDLKKLRILNLEHNSLTGTIPDAFGGMTELIETRLSENRLSGSIPHSIASVGPTLRELYLDSNLLTGSIPSELGTKLAGLETLFLHKNQLGGEIPTELGQLASLRELTLNENGLEGSIPTELGGLSRLENLFLEMNLLTGRIPESLGGLVAMEMLRLYENNLTGSVPAKICDLAISNKNVWVAVDCDGDDPEVECDCCRECH